MKHTQKWLAAISAATLMAAASTAPVMAQQLDDGWISVTDCAPAAPLIPASTTETCGSDVLDPILVFLDQIRRSRHLDAWFQLVTE